MGEEPWMKDLQAFLNRGPGVILRLRGLPYDCSAQQVVDFFARGSYPADVKGGTDGVFFVRKHDGKATGDAFAMFSNEPETTAAMTKHKDLIGVRYIELFRTAFSEAEQVIRRTLEAKSKPSAPRVMPHLVLPQHPPPQPSLIPTGAIRDCIRLRGLPFEAQVQHILDFLGIHSKNIVLQGVHMVYNHLGQPSGEAFIQMNSETAASAAAFACSNQTISIGKKPRLIEVHQCSGEDMVSFLNGAAPTLPSSGLGDMMSPMLRLYPTVLEGGCPVPPVPVQTCSPVTAPPMLYFVFSPQDGFFSPMPMHDWSPDFAMSPPVLSHVRPPLQQPDFILS